MILTGGEFAYRRERWSVYDPDRLPQRLNPESLASCWRTLNETHQTDKLSLSDGLELLLQSELDNRCNNRIDRLIRNTDFGNRECSDFGNSNAPISVTTIHNFR